MQDVLFVILVLAFFTLAAGVVRLCDRVVGGAEVPTAVDPTTTQEAQAA